VGAVAFTPICYPHSAANETETWPQPAANRDAALALRRRS